MLEKKSLLKKSALLSSMLFCHHANAWIPCQIICDSACMGLSFDMGTMNTLVYFETIATNASTVASSIGQTSESMGRLSDSVSSSFDTAAENLNKALNVDAALVPAMASREVKAINGLTINVKSAIDEHTEILANNTLELINTTNEATKAFTTMERKRLDKKNTSDVFDSIVQNSYEITKHFETKTENIGYMLEKSAASDETITETVNGKGNIKSKEVISANQDFENIIFSLTSPNDKESWEYTPLIATNPATLSLLTTDYKSIGKTKELRAQDSQKLLSGTEIDLKALNLLKSQRRNLYLYEIMQSANFSVGEVND